MKRKEKRNNNTSRYTLTIRDYRGDLVGTVESATTSPRAMLDAVHRFIPVPGLQFAREGDDGVVTRVLPSFADPRPDLRWTGTAEPLDPRGISEQLLEEFHEEGTP